ncbi:ATP-binding protein [Acinetobacter sp. KS-LM10]|uniref:ATP-binding protein n=1 Tax=Acinetobacter sp. KS-LM10 TaxID=3120518 RepID=UPI0030CBB8E8
MIEKNLADTRPAKDYLVNGITKDVTIEECIFDLIDNSIDAYPLHTDIIISDYKNYTINLNIKKNLFSILDSGKGIQRELLKTDTLRFGTKTIHHSTSIGYYGIGLNRAIFKLGREINIVTETTLERSSLKLDVSSFLKDNDNWSLPIAVEKISKQTGTFIEIKKLNDDVNICFANNEWLDDLKNEIALRYSEFINKNLIINVNEKPIDKVNTSIRITSDFKKLKEDFTHKNIRIIIEAGQSSQHFFTYEKSYNKEKNATLNESGWFVYCNDRAVKLFDKTSDTGWASKVHSQHTGFIGRVFFIGNAGILPWNTSKTDIDLNNEVYKKILETMTSFFNLWKSHTYKVLKKGYRPITEENPLSEDLFGDYKQDQQQQDQQQQDQQQQDQQQQDQQQQDQQQQDQQQQDQSETEDNSFEAGKVSDDFYEYDPNYTAPTHITDYEYLFENKKAKIPFFIPDEEVKLRSLLAELIKIRISALPIATLMLMRAFIELSCQHYSKKFSVDIKLKKPSLAQTVTRCLNKMEEKNHLKLDSRRISTLHALCNEQKFEKSFLAIQNLQITIHSDDLIWDKRSILSFWYAILPFLTACYNISQK